MSLSSLTRVMVGTALCSLACAHEVNEWAKGERPATAGSPVSPQGGAGGAGGSAPSAPTSGTAGGKAGAETGGGGSGIVTGGSGGSELGDATPAGAGGEMLVQGGSGGAMPFAAGAAGDAGSAGTPAPGFGGASSGGDCDALPEWEARSYAEYERVTDGSFIYECKPWPETAWCGASEEHYEPGTGSDWDDAWTLVGPC